MSATWRSSRITLRRGSWILPFNLISPILISHKFCDFAGSSLTAPGLSLTLNRLSLLKSSSRVSLTASLARTIFWVNYSSLGGLAAACILVRSITLAHAIRFFSPYCNFETSLIAPWTRLHSSWLRRTSTWLNCLRRVLKAVLSEANFWTL